MSAEQSIAWSEYAWNSSDKEILMRPSRKLTCYGVGVKNWLDGGRESPRSEIDRSDAHWLACGIGFAVTNIGFWHSVLDVPWLISGRSSGLLANLSCDVHIYMHAPGPIRLDPWTSRSIILFHTSSLLSPFKKIEISLLRNQLILNLTIIQNSTDFYGKKNWLD
jgi:hypothetical protein